MHNGVIDQPRTNGSAAIRVLIADPDESLLGEYREHSRIGFEVVTASDGLACVEQLRQQTPDVLVLEPQLPWGGGDGVLSVMRDVLDLATIPVMILTSCRDPLVLDKIARFPISDFHPKPLSPAKLVKRLKALLEHHTHRKAFQLRNRRLETLIAKETGGRIHRLFVESKDGRIIVHGRSATYHARQLVLGVVMDAIASPNYTPPKVELDIQVCGSV